MINVIFSHGKETGPEGSKIQYLRSIVDSKKDMQSHSIDYQDLPNSEDRVIRLIDFCKKFEKTILVGSSMGAYVSTCASKDIHPLGLFLLAPAFYLPGYENQNPIPKCKKGHIIFGYDDEIIPIENITKFSTTHKFPLTLINSDHRLQNKIDYIGKLFHIFLDEINL